ncbi:MAG: CaiB/BaiF CoA transferase family protein [Alphaproteobacteria bacterium]
MEPNRSPVVPETLPLSGVRVLELGSTVAGPAAGRLLADFGAEVLKIEAPDGDHLRTWGEPAPDGTSWWFKSHNRNKVFLSFNLRDEADLKSVQALAASSDVVLENFRPGQLAKWGLGYRELSARNPRLVYVSISGYGQDGPYASRPGFGHIAESMSGFRYVTGFPDRPPVRVGLSIGDEIAGLYAVIGTMMALRARDRDGVGDHVDISLIESLFSLTESVLPEYRHAGVVAERSGNRYGRAAPSNTYETRDRQFLSIAANSQPLFHKLCALLGRPELEKDPRFASNPARVANCVELDEIIGAWAASIDLQPALQRLNDAGIPAGLVYSIADIAADAQFKARGALAEVPDEFGAPIATPGLVPRLSRHPGRLSHAAKAIGADQALLAKLLNRTGSSAT